MTIGEFREY